MRVAGHIRRQRRGSHLVGVGVDDQFHTANRAAVNCARTRRLITGRYELLADRRTAGRARPGHFGKPPEVLYIHLSSAVRK